MGWQEHEEREAEMRGGSMHLVSEEPVTPTILQNNEAMRFALECQKLTKEINNTLKGQWRHNQTPTIKFLTSAFEELVIKAVRTEFEKSWKIEDIAGYSKEYRWKFSPR